MTTTITDHKQRLFIGVYPCGLVYADRSVEVAGDYRRLAFLSYATLQLDLEKRVPEDLRKEIIADAWSMQLRCGEQFQISSCGQTVLLGSAVEINPESRHSDLSPDLGSSLSLVVGSNSYHVLKQTTLDWYLNRRLWRKVTEELFFDQLEVLPPRRQNDGAFLTSEPYTHTITGKGIYSAFRQRGPEFHTMRMTTLEYDTRRFAEAPVRSFHPTKLELFDPLP